MESIDLEYPNALKVMVPQEESITLVMVGCGGTGSWLAQAVVRVGKVLIEKLNKDIEIVFIDPDRVEEKNIYRQNFCAAEIGRNKAETLAERYGMAWGIEVHAVASLFKDAHLRPAGGRSLMVIIGCVDNAKARDSIKDFMGSRGVWLDCGNTKSYGQVLLGVNFGDKDPFKFTGYCSRLPFPHEQHPELLNKGEEVEVFDTSGLSCADLALLDSQGLSINQRMAAEAADYLVRMLITRDLRKYATYIDLESGTTRSRYITEKAMRDYAKH